jgi:hypothetical protein
MTGVRWLVPPRAMMMIMMMIPPTAGLLIPLLLVQRTLQRLTAGSEGLLLHTTQIHLEYLNLQKYECSLKGHSSKILIQFVHVYGYD